MCNISNIRTWFVLAPCLDDDPLYHLIAVQTTLSHAFIESPGLPPYVRLSCWLGLPLRQYHRVCQTAKWQAGAHNLWAIQLRVVNTLLFILMLQKSLTLLEIIVKEFRLLSIHLRTYAGGSSCILWYLRVLSGQVERMRLVKLVFGHFLETWFWINQGSDFII